MDYNLNLNKFEDVEKNITNFFNKKNEEKLFSSCNFGTKNIIDDENKDYLNIPNNQVKQKNLDNMVFNDSFSNETKIKEVNPFQLSINKNKTKIRNIFNTIKKDSNNKSNNKFIILNNSCFKKELDFMKKKFETLNFNNKSNNEQNCKKINAFPCINNYTSIRKVFADITNQKNSIDKKKKFQNSKINKFKAKMPKNFEIHKRKINLISFNELVQKEEIKNSQIKYSGGGCCCKKFKNKLII